MSADPLRDLRAALAFQRELGGPFVPAVPERPLSGSASQAEADVTLPATAERAEAAPTAATHTPSPDDRSAASPFEHEPDPTDDAMASIDLFGGDAPPPASPSGTTPSGTPYERIDARIPAGHVVKPAATLEELEGIVRAHTFLPLDTQRLLPVFGTGDPHAGLVIIGEAPGADEDRTGEPFVGRAGQLLNKILTAIGFERSDVYITNILKSRPPGNRTPEPDEIAAHLPILLKQLALIQPKVILCVGTTAGNALLGRKSSLAALRDREHSFDGVPLFVTYHPAALLRNEAWKRPTWEDVKLMRTRYDALMSGG